jgi:hypothetical protein
MKMKKSKARVNSSINALLKASKYYIQGGDSLSSKDFEIELNEITLHIIEAKYFNKACKLNINQAKENVHCYQVSSSRQITFNEFLKRSCNKLKITNPNIRCYANRTVLEYQHYSLTLQDLILSQVIHLNDLICIDQSVNGSWELDFDDAMKAIKSANKCLVGLSNIGNSNLVISLLYEFSSPVIA